MDQNVHQALGIASRGYVLEPGEITVQGGAADLLVDVHARLAYPGQDMGEGE
jgi:branched-chain amino acid transport system ATP-binding protein